jgi:hypothetical protein
MRGAPVIGMSAEEPPLGIEHVQTREPGFG